MCICNWKYCRSPAVWPRNNYHWRCSRNACMYSYKHMMTSWHGNEVRVFGLLGWSTCDWWIPLIEGRQRGLNKLLAWTNDWTVRLRSCQRNDNLSCCSYIYIYTSWQNNFHFSVYLWFSIWWIFSLIFFLPLQNFTAKISRYIDLSIDTSVYHYILVLHIVHWKQKSRKLGNSVVTGGTVSCHYDN